MVDAVDFIYEIHMYVHLTIDATERYAIYLKCSNDPCLYPNTMQYL